jgi:hypothetical protein
MMGGFLSDDLAGQAARFKHDYAQANSDFQTEFDYDKRGGGCCGASSCGKNKTTTATAFVENQFNCLSLLLEMPFTDNANKPNQLVGWSALRSIALGRGLLVPIGEMVFRLKA